MTEISPFETVDWEDYWRVGAAGPAEIARVEQALGVALPEDVKEALRSHQGMAPVPSMLAIFPSGPKIDFGPLNHCQEGSHGSIVDRATTLRRRGYPSGLVPLSMSSGGQSHFALDYSAGRDTPTVVLVRPELGYDSERCIVHVADSLTEVISMLEGE